MKQQLRYALQVTRYLYNQCVQIHHNTDQSVGLGQLRDWLINNSSNNILPEPIKSEFATVPYEVRDGAIRDFWKALKTQKKMVREGTRRFFTMSYRRKKDGYQDAVVLRYRNLRFCNQKKRLFAFPRKWPDCYFSVSELDTVPDHDVRVVRTYRYGKVRYYCLIPTDVPIVKRTEKRRVVALDPGVRSFLTSFDTEGRSIEFGPNDIYRLDRQAEIAARIRSGIKRTWVDGQRYYSQLAKATPGMLRAAARIEQKVKDKISDCHRKIAKFLTQKYETIIIPKFDTQNMVQKRNYDGVWKRRIGKKTSRQMIRWSHYRFRELLIAKAEQMNSRVIVGSEHYSSKVCSHCLCYNARKDEKEFVCSYCGLEADRDVNAARNILYINWQSTGLRLEKQKRRILRRRQKS